MTIRFHAVRGSEAYPPDRLAAGGRWERLLRALADGPMGMGQLAGATDPGDHPKKLERSKVRTALQAMARAGLVESTPYGWTLTPAGSAGLQRLERDGAGSDFAPPRGSAA